MIRWTNGTVRTFFFERKLEIGSNFHSLELVPQVASKKKIFLMPKFNYTTYVV